MKRSSVLHFGCLTLLTAGLASAQTWSDDLESYTAGSALEGQGGWAGWDNINTAFTTVSTLQARSGAQSMELNPGSDTVQEFTPSPTAGTWVFEAWAFVPTGYDAELAVMIMNNYNVGGPYEWGSWVVIDGTTGLVTCNCGGFGSATTTLPLDRWFEIKKVIDLDADFAEIFIDGMPFTSYSYSGGYNGSQNHQVPSIHAIDLYSDPNAGAQTQPSIYLDDIRLYELASVIGSNYCTAAPNSTGAPGTTSAIGSLIATSNDVTLTASDLPLNQFGIFVTSRTQGFSPFAGGTSNGNLCLAGTLGRFSAPNQIMSSGPMGSFSLAVDLSLIPEGGAFAMAMAGDTWNFQAWHRDGVGLGSNFTDGLSLTFQ